MAGTTTENDNLPIGEFTPFNDTDGPRIQQAVLEFNNVVSGYDTTVVDRFRQGVNLTLPRYVYQSLQPKVWTGRLDHQARVVTIGQARSFTEFEDSTIFEEQPEFNPVWYIEDPNYPFPIVFNNGPQQEEEAIIEPFTIPMRKNTNIGPFYPRSVKGSVEDGNSFDNLDGSSNFVEQFIDYDAPLDPRFFLDEGQGYFGTFPTASHLNTENDPLVLYTFDGNILDSSGNGKVITLSTGSLSFSEGPFPGSQALFVNQTAFSSSIDPDFFLTGSCTVQAFIQPGFIALTIPQFIVSIGAAGETLADNILASIAVNPDAIAGKAGFLIEGGAGVNYIGASNVDTIRNKEWYHVAASRNSDTTSLYLNGELVAEFVHVGFPEAEPMTGSNLQTLIIGTTPGTLGELGTFAFSGSISNVKINTRALSQAEVRAEYARVFPVQGGAINTALAESIIVPGFQAVTIRNIDPFDDTRDERIVARLQTTDPNFISAVKALDFDLSEDIRGTFARKSATAGGDVYGSDAAIYGTDSIAYRGLFRGA